MASSLSAGAGTDWSWAETEPRTKVIALVDMDCFECQVWQRMYPAMDYWGRPCIVADKGGRIVSVTYEARELGINREMRVRDARQLANTARVNLRIFEKPNDREKPDGKATRYASWEILDAIKDYVNKQGEGVIIEYASSDEFFLDITSEVEFRLSNPDVFGRNMLIEGRTFLEAVQEKMHGEKLKKRVNELYQHTAIDKTMMDEKRLVYGAVFIQELLNSVFSKTKFTGSAGIGTNKLMAKLGVSLNKPNAITVFPDASFTRISHELEIQKVSGFGGKFGAQVKEIFNVTKVKELMDFELEDLENVFGKEKALEAYLKCRGICDEPVMEKLHSNEVSCAKSFFSQITSNDTLIHHVKCLAEEMVERLDEEAIRHKRKPTTIRASLTYSRKDSRSRDSRPRASEEPHNWSTTIEKPTEKDANRLTNETVDGIFKVIKSPISSLKITKACFTAKGFREI